jgi:hypothetical protein
MDPPVFPDPLQVEYPIMTEDLMMRLLWEVREAAVQQTPAPLWPATDGGGSVDLGDEACGVSMLSDRGALPGDLLEAPRGQVDPVEVMADDGWQAHGGDLDALVQQAVPGPEETLEERDDPWELYRQQMMDPGMMGFGPAPG